MLGSLAHAWLAQQNMRHKSSKTAFRAIYWATIVLHCAAPLAGFLHWVGAFKPGSDCAARQGAALSLLIQ